MKNRTSPREIPGAVQERKKAQNPKPLILVVEDHEDTRFLFSYVMEECGFRVIQARDGAEAVFISQETLPDLILMDVALPEVDGVTATRAIRNIAALRDVPVAFVSGRAEPQARAAAVAAGANEYFVKPVNLSDLEIAVRKHLARNRRLKARLRKLSLRAQEATECQR